MINLVTLAVILESLTLPIVLFSVLVALAMGKEGFNIDEFWIIFTVLLINLMIACGWVYLIKKAGSGILGKFSIANLFFIAIPIIIFSLMILSILLEHIKMLVL